MKPSILLSLTPAVLGLGLLSASAQSFRGMDYMDFADASSDEHTTLAIKPDGSCVVTNASSEPRKAFEMQILNWERYEKSRNADLDEDATPQPPPPPPKPDQKPLSDADLAAKLRAMYDQRSEDFDEAFSRKVDTIEVTTNSVRVVSTSAFSSLKDLASQGLYGWGPTMLMFENARLEMDTNHQFRISFTPSKNADRYAKSFTRGWKDRKIKSEWKLVLPGKILSSGLPQTQQNTTWLTLDSEKPETIDAAFKLLTLPLVITAEPGGLALAEALDTKTLMRTSGRNGRSQPDLPITDASPGFVAESSGLTISTWYLFPEGEKLAKDRDSGGSMPLANLSPYSGEAPGVLITAKLFAPKGRTIKSVTDLKVKSAKDDKGRAVPMPADENGDEMDASNFGSIYGSDNSDKSAPARIQLRLGLPAPDAQVIDELQAEAVALTIGSWKEMTLTNVQADTNQVIDLGEVLPGAKLIITKLTAKRNEITIQARIEGPAAVSQLEIQVKSSNRRGGNSSNMNERRTSTSGNITKRNVTISSYDYDSSRSAAAASAPVTLLMRFPQDVKRERVQFKLTALDLL